MYSPQGEWATQHVTSTLRNNAELCDHNDSQKLTQADIAAMKASGKVSWQQHKIKDGTLLSSLYLLD
jgi:hypothetical protein